MFVCVKLCSFIINTIFPSSIFFLFTDALFYLRNIYQHNIRVFLLIADNKFYPSNTPMLAMMYINVHQYLFVFKDIRLYLTLYVCIHQYSFVPMFNFIHSDSFNLFRRTLMTFFR